MPVPVAILGGTCPSKDMTFPNYMPVCGPGVLARWSTKGFSTNWVPMQTKQSAPRAISSRLLVKDAQKVAESQ